VIYNKVTENTIEKLKKIVCQQHVCTEKVSLEDYTHDETPELSYIPECVVKPKTATEISEIVKLANNEKIPITPRGLGTGLCGGSLAIYGGIVISMERFNKILELDYENSTLLVESGVSIQTIHDFVEPKGLYYPPNPGEKGAAIGGTINTNAGGMHAVKYGVTRDYVIGLEVVLPTGEIINVGGKVLKSSSGYELIDLFIGSEGTLAIVTKALLKLIPLPKYKTTLYVPFDNTENVFTTCKCIFENKIIPTALEFMQHDLPIFAEKKVGDKFPESSHKAYLIVLLDGDFEDSITNNSEKISNICMENNAIEVYILDTKDAQNRVWNLRSNVLEGIKEVSFTEEIDAVVPRSNLYDYLKYLDKLSMDNNIKILSYGHVGDGNMHTHIFKYSMNHEEWNKVVNDCLEKIYLKTIELGGKISGEHGIGCTRKKYLKYQLNEHHIELMRKIKKVFDPNVILNPGKIFDYDR